MVNCNFLKSNQTVWEKLALTGNSFTAHQQILKTAYNQSMFLNTGNPKLYHNWNKDTICMGITSNLVWNYDKYWAGIVGCLQSLTIPLFLFSFWVGSSGCLGYHHSPSMCPGVRRSDTKAPTRHPAQNYRNHQQVLQSLILYYVHFMFWNFDHIRIEEIFIMCLKHKCSHLCMNIKWNTWIYLAVTVC